MVGRRVVAVVEGCMYGGGCGMVGLVVVVGWRVGSCGEGVVVVVSMDSCEEGGAVV